MQLQLSQATGCQHSVQAVTLHLDIAIQRLQQEHARPAAMSSILLHAHI